MPSIDEQLMLHEGVRLKPYRDTVGKLTIGVGRNLDDVGLFRSEADFLLSNDIARVYRDCLQAFPFFTALDHVRQKVLLDMCFNLGIAGLKKFKRTLGYVAAGEYDKAAAAMLESKWARQVGKRAHRLAEMMRSGNDYTN
jgi:lysozyme